MEHYLFMSDRQDVVHGDQLLPFGHYHCIIPDNIPDVLMHWHEEAEITYVWEGHADYQIGDEHFRSSPGDVIIAGPNTLHAVYPVSGCRHVSDTLVVHLDFIGLSVMDQCSISYLRPFYNGKVQMTARLRPEAEGYQVIADCVKAIFQARNEQEECYELVMKEKLFRLLYLMYRNKHYQKANESEHGPVHTDKIKAVLQYIQQHYKEQITVEQLAELSHFSKAHFMEFFRQATGMTCMEYVIQLRLKAAKELLKMTELSIVEVSMEAGFHNLSNFNRMFRKYTGMTPGEYRKNKDVRMRE